MATGIRRRPRGITGGRELVELATEACPTNSIAPPDLRHVTSVGCDQAGRPLVILFMRGSGPMQNMQTVWSLAFGPGSERGRSYEWLCHRLDRWPHWAELASAVGSQKLTHRLLGVMAASLEDEAAQPARCRISGLIGG